MLPPMSQAIEELEDRISYLRFKYDHITNMFNHLIEFRILNHRYDIDSFVGVSFEAYLEKEQSKVEADIEDLTARVRALRRS